MTEAAQENQDANSLIISQYPWVNELNPSVTYRFSELQVIRSIYDTLFTIDSNGQLSPHLACDYQTDGEIYLYLASPGISEAMMALCLKLKTSSLR